MKVWAQEIELTDTNSLLQKIAARNESQNSETDFEDKRLLTIAEFAKYLGIGQTSAREILKNPKLGYRVRVNNTVMVNKRLLDEYLDKKSY